MRRVLVAGVLAALCVPRPGNAQEVGLPFAGAVASVVPEGLAREVTRCKLQNAVWGGYDVQVHITMGTDGLPYLFELRGGQFTRQVDPEPMPGPNRFERSGRVGAGSLDEAFGKGLPFYLTPAEPVGPGQVALRVEANPAVPVTAATLLVTIDQPGVADLAFHTMAVDVTADRQRLLVTHEALRGPVLLRAAILKDIGTNALMLGCVLSNELEFRPVM